MTVSSPAREQIPALRALWQEAFGDTDVFLDSFFGIAFSPDRALCATEGDELAAMLYWFDCTHDERRVAYVYAVATAKAFRGRGVCSALMRQLHVYLQGAGYAGVILVPSEPSLFDFYGRLGYLYPIELCETEAEAEACTLVLLPIDGSEYAKRRRALLPQGSILQEGVCMEFLAAQTSFYAADGLILAANREGDRLICKELLCRDGVRPQLGAIVSALGCKSGRFRMPDGGRRFAAYCNLDGGAVPRYFAFAFD